MFHLPCGGTSPIISTFSLHVRTQSHIIHSICNIVPRVRCYYIPSAFDRSARAYIISCAFVYIQVRSICMREYVHKVQCVTIFPVRPVRSSAVLSLTATKYVDSMYDLTNLMTIIRDVYGLHLRKSKLKVKVENSKFFGWSFTSNPFTRWQ